MNYEAAVTMMDYTRRWEEIFELLAMERTELFLADMGLGKLHAAAAREIAREYLVEAWYSERELEEVVTLVQRTVNQMTGAVGTQVGQALLNWGTRKFPFRRQRHDYDWKIMLWWLGGIIDREAPTTLPELSNESIKEIVQAVQINFGDQDLLEQRFDQAEDLPKSEWEYRIYERGEPGYSPLMALQRTIQDYQFNHTWATIRRSLSEVELQALQAWARKNAPSLQISPEALELPL